MRTLKTEGIIIKRRNYGEADRVLTVFTRYYGKIEVRAVGIRRIPSRRSAHVELLNHSILSLYKGRNMPILTEAQVVKNFASISNSLEKIGDAYHLCELVDGLCPVNQENAKVFDMLKNILALLCESQSGTGSSPVDIREFEIELLSTLGYSNRSDMTGQGFDMRGFIEGIMERKLKSRFIFAKMQ